MNMDVSFVSDVTNVAAFEELLLDYYALILRVFEAAGGPILAPQDLVDSSIDHLDEMLPPKGRLALARCQDRRLMGCGALRRIRPDAVEMKRMFVRPEAQGQGLGRKLFEMRIAEGNRMG
jgi:GNAT superfamily N-acetyltransferase